MSLLELVTAKDLGYAPGEDINGIDIGENLGWTGNSHRLGKPPFGKAGWRLDLEGHKVIGPQSSFVIARGSGFTEILGAEIVMGGWMGVQGGEEKASSMAGDLIYLKGCSVVGDTGRWGVHVRNMDLGFEDCVIDATLGEHHVYWGGPARWGLRARRTKFLNARYEALKSVQRPWESQRYVRGRIDVEDCEFDNCSSGIVVQGAGCQVHVRKTAIKNTKAPIRFDDGLTTNPDATPERYYDHMGVIEGPGAANNNVLIEDTAIEGSGQLIAVNEIPSFTGSWLHTVLLSLDIRRCGLWADGRASVSVPRALTRGGQRIHDNNTDAIRDFCRSQFGMAATSSAAVYE